MVIPRARLALWKIRPYSTIPLNASIYVSTSTSPHFNLSVEDWLFRKASQERPLLLLFRNEPCVVIGRNQNPWKEINFGALRALGVPFVRRRSGGGSVYHDLGNTNFSIHVPRAAFNRHHTAHIIQRTLMSLGIDAEINERNDICVGGYKMSTQLLGIPHRNDADSGLHLGIRVWLGLQDQLGNLGNLLHNTKDTLVTKGVASVRSPVHNLQQFKSDVSHSAFVDAVVENFAEEYEVDSEVHIIHDEAGQHDLDPIKAGIAELQQWDWQYGQTPEFTHRLTGNFAWGEVIADIHSKHGLILSCHLSSDSVNQTWCKDLGNSLVGVKYGSLEGVKPEDQFDHPRHRQDILEWLREEM